MTIRCGLFLVGDLPPSLLAITDVTAPTRLPADGPSQADAPSHGAAGGFDGVPLPQVLLGRSDGARDRPLFFRRPPDRDAFHGVTNLPDLAVRDGRWKLLCEYDGSQAQLYDLDTDPGESRNLAEQHPDLRERLTAQLLAWHRSLPPAP